MVMHSVSVIPLIEALCDRSIHQVWFANDASAGGTLSRLRKWWSRIQSIDAAYAKCFKDLVDC